MASTKKADEFILKMAYHQRLNTCGGRWKREPKIIENFYQDRNPREYEEYSPTLRADRSGLMVAEPICLNSQVNGKQPSLQDRVYDTNGTSTAITTSFMPSIAIGVATVGEMENNK